ncbi:MAG: UDP-N-acetylmuramate--L-alanine ligase [Candidatus Kerfeldbacteria bacterium]|nr:UDP-N-acetylmuramate--L-alanine ligase [Candidatus Kerfeldbacteria bacterium]
MFNNRDHLYCIGIGGIGVSALARFAMARGARVSGSDLTENDLTKQLCKEGISVEIDSIEIPDDVTRVIYSPAVPETAPQREQARVRGIPTQSYPEALGEIVSSFPTSIAVSGTNGKSTTTAMLGQILEHAGMNPTVIVGTLVPSWENKNIRFGGKDFIIVEACEWREHFHHIQPTHAIVTNIEEEHLDYFRDLHHLYESFSTFLRPVGTVVMNERIPSDELHGIQTKQTRTFGIQQTSNVFYSDVQFDHGSQVFSVHASTTVFDVRITRPGIHNIENALAAIAMALELGVPIRAIQDGLSYFSGIWRRFELRGTFHSALVFSDYGHHPSAIISTIEGAREFYPDRRIILVFQPHQRQRTQYLFQKFVKAFQAPDLLILTEIYDVPGREVSDVQISIDDFKPRLSPDRTIVMKDPLDIPAYLAQIVKPDDIVIIMGAGPIDQLATTLTRV